MADILSPAARSRLMSRIRGKDTRLELRIRKALHARGFRYCLGGRGLPGRPDLVLPAYSSAIFINGCFWHGHDCPLFRLPATRTPFWADKIERNIRRDAVNHAALRGAGWYQCVIWECAVRGKGEHAVEAVADRVERWLAYSRQDLDIRGNAHGSIRSGRLDYGDVRRTAHLVHQAPGRK